MSYFSDELDMFSDGNNRVSIYQNLFQQRPFYQSAPSNTGCYCNCMLLDDVGNCLSRTDEPTHSLCPS